MKIWLMNDKWGNGHSHMKICLISNNVGNCDRYVNTGLMSI